MSVVYNRRRFIAALAASLPAWAGATRLRVSDERLVTLGGSITELVFALGAGERIVATDESSIYPTEVAALPKVGYFRQFSPEGVLAQRPHRMLAAAGSGPEAALALLERAGITVHRLPDPTDLSTARQRILTLGEILDVAAKAHTLAESYASAIRSLAAAAQPLRVAVFFTRGAVAGQKTAAGAALRMVGWQNAFGSITGIRVPAPEVLVNLPADVIVLAQQAVDAAGSLTNALAQWPGLARHPAALSQKIAVVDWLALVGFGPRLPQTLREIARAAGEPR